MSLIQEHRGGYLPTQLPKFSQICDLCKFDHDNFNNIWKSQALVHWRRLVKFDKHPNKMGWEQYKKRGTNRSENILWENYWKQKKRTGWFCLFIKKTQQTNQMRDISNLCLPNVKHQGIFFSGFHFEHGGGDRLIGFGLASSSYMSCTWKQCFSPPLYQMLHSGEFLRIFQVQWTALYFNDVG